MYPGWTSYRHRSGSRPRMSRHCYAGRNASGRGWPTAGTGGGSGFNGGLWDIYGNDVSLLQMDLTLLDGIVDVGAAARDWRFATGPITGVGIYEGRPMTPAYLVGWSTSGFDDSAGGPAALPFESLPGHAGARDRPGVEVTETLKPQAMERRAGRKVRFDLARTSPAGCGSSSRVWPGRPSASSTPKYSSTASWPPGHCGRQPSVDRYTFGGIGNRGVGSPLYFPRVPLRRVGRLARGTVRSGIVAEVIHTDMRRTGWFNSSHELLNKLHENTVWGMRDNFVDLPTDCPQRDERLGWTGDIQVFAPAATFLYASTGTLLGWLKDVAAEQQAMGSVPNFVPWIDCGFPADPAAAWGDAAVIVPWVLYQRTGDQQILTDQLPSMKAWVDLVEKLSGSTGLWNTGFQLGDWLDPTAPPENPGDSRTDKYLVATAYFVHSSKLLADTCQILGDREGFERYDTIHRKAKAAFQAEYVSASGRVVSDTPTALSLALCFDLLATPEHRRHAGERLVQLVVAGDHRIQTGFVGTPIICDALAQVGAIDTAYHLLLQEEFPSWLYPVTLGATTIWERWDSMLPNGEVNPGEMTSFNHYALGAVVDFMHRVVAGLAPAAPGYAEILVAPRPGGGLTHASARHLTPYGPAEVSWRREHQRLLVQVTVPHGTVAHIDLPGQDDKVTVGSGTHHFETHFTAAELDAPRPVMWRPHSREAVSELIG